MAIPPRSGIGLTCTFRGPGWSTIPNRIAKCRTGIGRPSDAISATANAIKSARVDIAASLPSTCRKHLLEDAANLLLLLGCKIPVHGLAQAYPERSLRFPAHEFFCQGIVCDTIHRAGGHIRAEANVRLLSGKFEDHFCRVDYTDALHGSKIDRGTVIDFFRSENSSTDDVIHIGPIADLRAVTPDVKGILPDKSARDHCDHSVIFHSARAVYREVPARRCFQTVFPVISLKRKLRHQLSPSVHIVGVVRRFYVSFAQVKLLLCIGLHVVRIYTTRGGIDDFADSSLHRFPKDQAIEKQV